MNNVWKVNTHTERTLKGVSTWYTYVEFVVGCMSCLMCVKKRCVGSSSTTSIC